MKKSDQNKLNYASKYASISNYYKKWKGENLGIFKSNAIQNKIRFEKLLMDSLKIYENYQNYDIINKYDSLYNELRIYSFLRSTFIEKVYRGVDFFAFTNNIWVSKIFVSRICRAFNFNNFFLNIKNRLTKMVF